MESDIEQEFASGEFKEWLGVVDDDDGAKDEIQASQCFSTVTGFLENILGFLILVSLLIAWIGWNILALGGCIVFSPLGLMIIFSFKLKLARSVKEASPDIQGVYAQSRHKETLSLRMMLGSYTLLARSGLLLLLLLLLSLSVPRLKALTLLGSPLWKWSLLAAVLASAYFLSMAVYLIPTYLVPVALCIVPKFRMLKIVRLIGLEFIEKMYYNSDSDLNPYLAFYYGLFPSATLVTYSGIILVFWLFYFRTEKGLRHPSTPHPQVFEYATWTFVSLCIGSILLFLKSFLLLKWTANAIYSRFQAKILITSVKFFYLGLLVGGFRDNQIFRELNLNYKTYLQKEYIQATLSMTRIIMSGKVHMKYLQYASRLLTSIAQVVAPLEDDGVPELVRFLDKQDFCRTTLGCELREDQEIDSSGEITRPDELENFRCRRLRETITPLLDQENRFLDCTSIVAHSLLHLVQEQSASEKNQFPLGDLKKWLVDAHMNCVNMGRTLADANAIVSRLDIFLSFIVFIVVLLLWLLITGIANTTVLVTVATPLLALTFIFGDSSKEFFQGIIFCFGTHAFDVGDRCILDDTELEVRSMGILTTTFVKVGTTEKRVYPNSVLATKAIVNLGGEPDPSDAVELTLDYSTTLAEWKILEKKVEEFFNDPHQKDFFKSWHEVTMKESGDKIKVTIRFKHVLNVNEMTHGECLQKKNRQRSKILQRINHFLDHTTSPTNATNDKKWRAGHLSSLT